MNKRRGRIAVGLSGGVDSSVAAALLKKEGYDVIGLSMEIYDESMTIPESGRQTCYSPNERINLESAASVCEKLGIPFYVIDLKEEFRKHVIENFRNEYLKGRTPNPCIVCNQRLKFGFMLNKARESGIDIDRFATGHYARIYESDGRLFLKRSQDSSKDQTYFLYSLTQKQLSHTIFPLGEYTKDEVREIARAMGLQTFKRPESQDFLPDGNRNPFFSSDEISEGEIVNREGDILGRHKGIIYYTIGQRKGLGISSPEPVYVAEIDAINNRIIVSDKASIYSKGLIASDVNLIDADFLKLSRRAEVKIRYKHKGAFARISGLGKNRVQVIFDKPQLSVTPGQYAVFYDNDMVTGGGVIERAIEKEGYPL